MMTELCLYLSHFFINQSLHSQQVDEYILTTFHLMRAIKGCGLIVSLSMQETVTDTGEWMWRSGVL